MNINKENCGLAIQSPVICLSLWFLWVRGIYKEIDHTLVSGSVLALPHPHLWSPGSGHIGSPSLNPSPWHYYPINLDNAHNKSLGTELSELREDHYNVTMSLLISSESLTSSSRAGAGNCKISPDSVQDQFPGLHTASSSQTCAGR